MCYPVWMNSTRCFVRWLNSCGCRVSHVDCSIGFKTDYSPLCLIENKATVYILLPYTPADSSTLLYSRGVYFCEKVRCLAESWTYLLCYKILQISAWICVMWPGKHPNWKWRYVWVLYRVFSAISRGKNFFKSIINKKKSGDNISFKWINSFLNVTSVRIVSPILRFVINIKLPSSIKYTLISMWILCKTIDADIISTYTPQILLKV